MEKNNTIKISTSLIEGIELKDHFYTDLQNCDRVVFMNPPYAEACQDALVQKIGRLTRSNDR